MILSLVFLSLLCSASASRLIAKNVLSRYAKNAIMAAGMGTAGIVLHQCAQHGTKTPENIEFWRRVLRNAGEYDLAVFFKWAPDYALEDLRTVRQEDFLNALKDYKGDSEELKRLLEEGADPNSHKYGLNDFFHYAILHNFPPDVIKCAIRNKVLLHYYVSEHRLVPLDRAIIRGRYDIARVIIRNGGYYGISPSKHIKDIVTKLEDDEFDGSVKSLMYALYIYFKDEDRRMFNAAKEYLETANKPKIKEFFDNLL